ncbi:MAG: TRZ/ATZ family hydrolase, partial [Pseudomonadota bacterium]
TLILAGWVAPVSQEQQLIENAAVAVHDGRIAAIGPADAVAPHWTAKHTVNRPDCLLIPGFVNAHTHAAMTLLRGVGDDLPLATWLNEKIWPLEGQFVSEDMVRDGSRLAVMEQIRGGVTCFNDMYFCPDTVAHVASEARMRVAVGLIVLDFPTMWAADATEYLARAQAVHDQLAGNALVTTQFAPHAPYTVSAETLARVRTLADQLDLRVHTHLHETAAEVANHLGEHGQRPFAHLDEIGLVNGNLLAAHMTQMQPDELERAGASGMSIVHCPESNLKLASGIAPVADMLAAGINVALGTDGAASNNNLDMIGEMRTAALLSKVTTGDATALPAHQALRMATYNGAMALGIEDVTGSLELGKWADMTCIDLTAPHLTPCYDPVSALVYSAQPADVRDVWVAGRAVLTDKTLTTIDSEATLARAQEWRTRIHAAL